MTAAVSFDAYDPAFVHDPYPTYARLRSLGPFRDDAWGLTFFSRHADVTGILRDRRFGRDIRGVLPLERVDRRTYPTHLPNWYRLIRGSFIDLEPPDHTRIRGAVNRAFTRTRAEVHRDRIASLADRLLTNAMNAESFDAIAGYATPIPITVIADLMGVPESDHWHLLDWSHAIVRPFDLNVTPAEEDRAEQAVSAFAEYLRVLVRQRQTDPGADLISELASADAPLPEDDLVATCILVLNAGHEATVAAIGNSLLALGRNPSQIGALDPDDPAAAVEELLRYDAPLQMFERWVLEDLEWRGVPLRAGEKVGLLFGSANHDPDAFVDPERLDLGRFENPHVAFGLGTHHCLGAPLARLEVEVAVTVAARRLAVIKPVVDEPPRVPSLVFRGVTSLPLWTR